jgi:hypothetical protein
MSGLNRFMRRGAIVGLLAAATSVAAASAATTTAATPTAARVQLAAPAAITQPLAVPVPSPASQGADPLGCLMFEYNLGPFGPLGPWGPYGPLHDKPHPACFGGGPDFNKK